MRKMLFAAMLALTAQWGQAQEKVMNIVKTDQTNSQTRVAELKKISFLAADEGVQGLMVKTVAGETTAVRFEANPVVTVAKGKLVVKPSQADAMEFEIDDIAEIRFGDTTTAIKPPLALAFVVQEGGALLRDIPKDVRPRVYTVDGRSLPVPPVVDGTLQLNRATLGSGIFIVKVGSFTTKIKL